MWNRRGCSSEILNLTPKGDQSGRGLSKFLPLKETAKKYTNTTCNECECFYLKVGFKSIVINLNKT